MAVTLRDYSLRTGRLVARLEAHEITLNHFKQELKQILRELATLDSISVTGALNHIHALLEEI